LTATTVAWMFESDGSTSDRHLVAIGPGYGFRLLCGAEIVRTPPATVKFDVALPVSCPACLELLARQTAGA